jgi:hypothetical protein
MQVFEVHEDDRDDEFADDDGDPFARTESREYALVSMYRDGTLRHLAQSPSEAERRVAEELTAEAEELVKRQSGDPVAGW